MSWTIPVLTIKYPILFQLTPLNDGSIIKELNRLDKYLIVLKKYFTFFSYDSCKLQYERCVIESRICLKREICL